MRERFCKVCRGWHALDNWPAECWREQEAARSSLPSPMLIRDDMPPTKSMADGKVYTSKSAIRETYKPSGNPQGQSYVEVGNERIAPRKPTQPDTKGIEAAIGKAMSRHGMGA